MTWIRTIPLADADEALRRAIEAQRALYPVEYETPVHPTGDGTSGIVASRELPTKTSGAVSGASKRDPVVGNADSSTTSRLPAPYLASATSRTSQAVAFHVALVES